MRRVVSLLVIGALFALAGCGGKASSEEALPRARAYSDVSQLAEAMNEAGRSCSSLLLIDVAPGSVTSQGVCADDTVLTVYDTPESKNLDVFDHLEGYVQNDHSLQILYARNWTILGSHLHDLQTQIGGTLYHSY